MYSEPKARAVITPLSRNSRGRPRGFNFDDALNAALEVFWSKGYEGTSISDLTDAMGVSKASLYASFGNKEELFQLALDLYNSEKVPYLRDALEQHTARDVAKAFMDGALDAQIGERGPKGCLGVISLTSAGDDSARVRALAKERTCLAQTALINRFERARSEGDLSADTDVAGLASYLFAILQGMSIQAVAGATRKHLERLIDTGMAIWPSK
jgi:AcrR family transcriptional regulator